MSKHGPLLLLGVWLAANLILFAVEGRDRIETDLKLGSRYEVRARRWTLWDADNAPAIARFESALAELKSLAPERVLFLAPPRSNPLTSAAYHDLYPIQVVLRFLEADPVRDLQAAMRQAGAGAALVPGQQGEWKVVRRAEGG